MEEKRKSTKRRWLPILCGLLFAASVPAKEMDYGGMSARFLPNEVRPGDLFVLSVEMHRDDFGQFVLEVPYHPRLHLVTRERIPPKVLAGRYHQEDRLMLQALSSGPITLTGIRAELIESSGTRTVVFPDMTVQVLPFANPDETDRPEPLPHPGESSGSRPGLIILLLLIFAGLGFAAFLLVRKHSGSKDSDPDTSPTRRVPDKIRTRDFEGLLEKRRGTLSPELQADLESYLYAPKHPGMDPAEIKTRLRKELGE